MADLMSLRGSVVIQAGAGTGKTHSLVTLCLHLLGGIGHDEPLPPPRLWAVTFTEKAAAELKGRIRQRVDALAEGTARLGPDAAFWRKVRRDLTLAQVGTIHGLCGQILRRHAAAAGIDPAFQMLDEAQGRRALQDACEVTSLRALEGALGPDAKAAALRLCTEMGLRAQGDFGSGLADELASLLTVLGESGRSARAVAEETRGLSQAAVVDEDQRARRALVSAMEALRSATWQARPGKVVQAAADAVAMFDPAALQGELNWPRLRAAYTRLPSRSGPLADAIDAAKNAFEAVLEADAGVRGAALARDLALLADHASTRHREWKQRAAALDFDDLTRLCRDLLAGHPAAREAEQERVGVLLVDEFQDTSRTQLELFSLLGGASMVVVGDRKQSIYEFRGADVAGAQEFAGRMLAQGAQRQVLRESRRSQPALVNFANLLFETALAAKAHPFDTPFTADDALTAFRPHGAACCAELLHVSGAGVEAEAEMVARRIGALLAPGAPERVYERDETARPVRGGDIAILLRRFTNLEAFRRALLRRRIPHLVYKGRGFHETREVMDLVALLTAAVDPDDALALAAVLRSPFGPVSDNGLTLLARGVRASGASGNGLDRHSLRDRPQLDPDDAEAVDRLAELLGSLHREVDRLGPAALLEAALAETDYVAACAGGLYGEQAAANIDKLLALARAAELRGDSVRAFLGSLQGFADEGAREAEAPVVEERDPHAVRLLTVHAAKGLEFPVVFVPECATPSQQNGAERMLLDPELGLAFKARARDGQRRWGPHGDSVCDRRRERELSQSRRLLYVAVTRARDLVVLSGRAARNQESWRGFLDRIAPAAVQRGLLRVVHAVDPPQLPVQRAPVDPAEVGALAPAQHPDVARLAGALPPLAGTIFAPVTQIADAMACPRRYRLLHELRLEERPEASAAETAGTAPATALGTLAHRLLELAPLQLTAGERRAELSRLLSLEGEDPAHHAEVIDAACAFLDSPLGKRMAVAKPGRLRRELPFTLRLEGAPELVLRGQIDALLLEDRAATVVDYKLSRARDPSHYAAQLDAYALAASELVEGALPVETGIVFLRTRGAPFAAHAPAETQAVRGKLLDAARAIAEGRRSGNWPGIEPERCRQLGCGFFRRCHPEKT